MIKDALVDIRFNNGRGYIFIYTFDYECILLPINRANEGQSVYDFKDSNGFYLGREIVKSLQNKDEAFLTWYYPKPDNLEKKDLKKIGFNVHFKPYNWFIGSGEYVEDFEENMKKDVLEHVSNLRTTKNDYFFILNYKDKTVFQKIDDLVDRSFQKFETKDEDLLFDEMWDLSKDGGGFLTYDYKTLNENVSLTKTSYIKALFSWNWIIGKGFFHNHINSIIEEKSAELNKKFNEKIKKILLISSILTIILLTISIYISRKLEKKFHDYKMELKKQQHILAQQSKMAAMGEMLGNIAHQWRQPLSVITTVATGMKLQKEFENLDDKTFDEAIENITNSALYLSKTIDDFRSFFKSDKKESFFNIKEVFEKVLKLTSSQFKNHEITIIKEINDFQIYGFENEFVQVLINILNNSKDALLDKESPRIIMISTSEKDGIYIIKIKDNGGGIENKILDKVCEPYFTTKHQSTGTGIGLYMTEEIIEKHMNGTLEINNCKFDYNNKEYFGVEVTILLNKEN